MLQNFILCNTTQRFIRSPKSCQKNTSRLAAPHGKLSFLYGTHVSQFKFEFMYSSWITIILFFCICFILCYPVKLYLMYGCVDKIHTICDPWWHVLSLVSSISKVPFPGCFLFFMFSFWCSFQYPFYMWGSSCIIMVSFSLSKMGKLCRVLELFDCKTQFWTILNLELCRRAAQ